MSKLIFGHKNPDTDTITSALVVAMAKKQMNIDAKACALGKVNKETEHVLNYLNLEAPEIVSRVDDNQEVILVDHNEFTQSVDNIEYANIVEVYDHHRIDNFRTTNPLVMNVQPVGCTATVLYSQFQNDGVTIDKTMATLMISAIISDTLLFKSPTCTDKDIEVADALAEIAGINLQEYGMEMLKSGTDFSSYSIEDLLNLDTKEFNTDLGKFEVGQINTADITEVIDTRGDDIKVAVKKRIEDNNLEFFLFVVTDIINSNSIGYLVGPKAELAAEKLGVTLEDDLVQLPGVVSRKKQIVPFL